MKAAWMLHRSLTPLPRTDWRLSPVSASGVTSGNQGWPGVNRATYAVPTVAATGIARTPA